MSAKRQFGFGLALRVVALITTTIVSLRLIPFIVHTIGDRSYGLWALVTTIGTYYGILDLGLSGAVTRHIAGAYGEHREREVNQVASTALAMYLAIGSLVFIFSAAGAGLGFLFFPHGPELTVFRKLLLVSGLATALIVPARVGRGLAGSVVALVLPVVLTIRFAEPSLAKLALLAIACFACFASICTFVLFNAGERAVLASILPISFGTRRKEAIADSSTGTD